MIWVLVRREDTDSEGRRPREDRGRDQSGAAASPAAPAARRSWKRQEGSSPWLWRERGHAGTLISGFRPLDQEGVHFSCPACGALLQQRRSLIQQTRGSYDSGKGSTGRGPWAGRSPQPSAPAPLLCCPPPCPLHLEHRPPPLTGLLITRKDLQMSLLPPYPN